jgi:hypothetical protein
MMPSFKNIGNLLIKSKWVAARVANSWPEIEKVTTERYYPARQSDAPGFAKGY